MSHLRTETTRIKDPQADLLKQVCEHIAGTEPGGNIKAKGKSYNSTPGSYYYAADPVSDIGVAIFTNTLTRGLVVNANTKDKDGRRTLSFEGDPYQVEGTYERVKGRVTGEYLDAVLANGFMQANYVRTESVADDRGGVMHTFLGPDSTKVFVRRDGDGRLEWNFEGFSGESCYDVQKVVSNFLAANGIEVQTLSVTDKRDERWLEERLPGREMEPE